MRMMLDKMILHCPGLENMAKAFFKMSRSSLRSLFSFLSLYNSSSGVFSFLWPGKAYWGSSEYSLIQRCSKTGWIPKLLATSVTLPSHSLTNCTASILNPQLNPLRVLLSYIWTPLLFHFNNQRTNLTRCPLKCRNFKYLNYSK